MRPESRDFDEIYKAFFPGIRQYLAKMVGEFQAEDLAQEVFNKVHKGLPGFKGDSGLSTWIYRIATHAAIDRSRTRGFKNEKATAPMEESPAQPSRDPGSGIMEKPPEQQVIKEEMNACIEEFVERLPYDYKAVLILSQYEQLKNREIADILNLSLETVKIRLHRARTRLKKELDAGCEFYHDENNILSCDRKQKNIRSYS